MKCSLDCGGNVCCILGGEGDGCEGVVWFLLSLLGSGFPAILRDRLYKTKAESLGLQPTFALSY